MYMHENFHFYSSLRFLGLQTLGCSTQHMVWNLFAEILKSQGLSTDELRTRFRNIIMLYRGGFGLNQKVSALFP